MMQNSTSSIVPVLCQTFAIIASGYVAKRWRLITTAGEAGLATFVAKFALPSLIFSSLVTLSFGEIDFVILFAVLMAKTVVFVIIFAVTYITQSATAAVVTTTDTNALADSDDRSNGGRLSTAAIYAIFCTQSNDFAFGSPIIQALYGGTDHANLNNYLYFTAPISLVILNPIAFAIIEIDSNSGRRRGQQSSASSTSVVHRVLAGLITNPVVVMTVAGAVLNPLFHMMSLSDQSSPVFWLVSMFQAMASAFGTTALFLLGLSMTNTDVKLSRKTSPTAILLLCLGKSLLLPILCRRIADALLPYMQPSPDLPYVIDFAFIYGTFPSAPAAYIYARHYRLAATDTVSSGVAIGTILSVPLTYLVVTLLKLYADAAQVPSVYDLFLSRLERFICDVSVVNLVVSLCLLISLCRVITTPYRRSIKSALAMLMVLVFSQNLLSLASIVRCWSGVGGWLGLSAQTVCIFSIYTTWTSTILLAMTLYFQNCAMFNKYTSWLVLALAGLLPATLTAVVVLVGPSVRLGLDERHFDPNFSFGFIQELVSFVLTLLTSLSVALFIFMAKWRANRFVDDVDPTQSGSGSSGVEDVQSNRYRQLTNEDDDDISILDTSTEAADSDETDIMVAYHDHCLHLIRYVRAAVRNCGDSPRLPWWLPLRISSSIADRCQTSAGEKIVTDRLVALLIFLEISVSIGYTNCTWTLLSDTKSGIYIGLAFLNALLLYGLDIFVAAILFSLLCQECEQQASIWIAMRSVYRFLVYGRSDQHAQILQANSLAVCDETTKKARAEFLAHHISLDRGQRPACSQNCTISGANLVTWLVGHADRCCRCLHLQAMLDGDREDGQDSRSKATLVGQLVVIEGLLGRHVLGAAPLLDDDGKMYELIENLDEHKVDMLLSNQCNNVQSM